MRVIGVDKLRALAALSVMLAHICGPHLPGIFRYIFTGHPAVIAFFVISGFCIHRPYVNAPLNIKAFLVARVVRVLGPVLIAMGLAKYVGIAGYNLADGFILWSVTCELWYYGLYPIFFRLSRIVSWRMQFAVSFVVAYAVTFYYGSDQYGNAHVYGWQLNWLTALPCWLLGCVVAEEPAWPSAHVMLWRAAVAGTASVLFWLTLNTPVGFYITMNLFGILAASRQANWLDWVGNWSFSIYLIHLIPAYALPYFKFRAIPFWLEVPVALVACLAFYYAVEKPAHILARKVFKRLSHTPAPAVDPVTAQPQTVQH